jgi:hypothetical protein
MVHFVDPDFFPLIFDGRVGLPVRSMRANSKDGNTLLRQETMYEHMHRLNSPIVFRMTV